MDLLAPFRALDSRSPEYAAKFAALLLEHAVRIGASDVHIQPAGPTEFSIRFRLDGVLQEFGLFPRGSAADLVTRLKVQAQLLTYRTDLPQEGRLRETPQSLEMRLSVFPAFHGERAVVRIFADHSSYRTPHELGFPPELDSALVRAATETSGAILIVGPAGSGKTTTAYAALRGILAGPHLRSIVTLEDPIESELPGVSQSQIQPHAGFDLAAGLRSLLRQDPEVILVGELRDRETAAGIFQASLTGHLVLSTFHAGSVAEAIGRLWEMGVEPYLVRSGLQAVFAQRLVRRLCNCRKPSEDFLGLAVRQAFRADRCEACLGTGYRGRALLVEGVSRSGGTLNSAILRQADVRELHAEACVQGLVPLLQRACSAVESGLTSPHEVRRVLGFLGD